MDRINIQGVNGIAARLHARGAAPVSPIDRAKSVASEADQSGTAVRSAARSGGAVPPVDEERVGRLRTEIEQGRYRLDPNKTADAMIASGLILRNER